MIEHLFMLTCGWVGGVVSTLLIRHTLDGRRPLDPALIPTSVAMPIAALPALPPAPQLSPYAPKPKRSWQAPKRERIARWVVDASRPPVAPPQHPQEKPALRTADAPLPLTSAIALLPSIAWGHPHDGEGQTLTQEVRAQSAAENGHHAQAPRRRS